MKRKPIFEADDGTTFETAAECKQRDMDLLILRIAEADAINIELAIDGKRPELAAAIERAGHIIRAKRRESGDLKRAKKQDAGAAFQGVEKAMADVAK